jgi:hypothetical protein
MSKNNKIQLYTKHDIEVIADNIDILMKDADKVVKTTYEPTIQEFREVLKVVREFIKSKNRIIYGGTALNDLIKNVNPKNAIYDELNKSDMEFYSPEPIQDLKEICDLLYSKNFKYVQGQQAQHGETYKFFVNFEDVGDISYVPLFIYNKMPTIEIDGLRYIHPKFMYIDYLRMYTDPLMSFFRLEKAIPRGMALINNYPLELGEDKIKYDELTEKEENIIKDISKIISNSNSFIHVGTYAIQFYTIDKETKLLPYEVISVEYKKDVNSIYEELNKKYKIETKEYFPYFQFWDRHIEFIFNNKVVLTIYKNYDRCIPYRKYDAGNIASFQQVLLHHLIKYYFNLNNKLDEKNVNNILGNIVKIRNEYLKKNNKTVMDDTIFREFQINCLGKSVDSRRQYFLDIMKKKSQGRQILYRYNPQTDYDHKLPDYYFDNTSGNLIKNPKLYTIKSDTSDSEGSEITSEDSVKSETNSEKKSGLPQMVSRNVKNIDTETKYPFMDSDYTSEAF